MPKAPPAEFREEAVRRVRSSGKRTTEIAADLRISCETLRTGFKLDQVDRVNASTGEFLGGGAGDGTPRARVANP